MKKSPLFVLFLVIFLDLVGFGVVIPILPYYSKTFGATAFSLGWLMAIYSIMQFLFSPFWGSLSDRIGRRPVLMITIFGGAISMFLAGFSTSYWMLFAARLLAGFFAANISTASAYIADVTTPENRAKGMGIIGAGFGLGFIFGPAIGGILSSHSYSLPILFAASLSVVNLVFAFFLLPESRDPSKVNPEGARAKWSPEFIKLALEKPETSMPILLFFLSTLAFTQLEVSFGLFVLAKFNYGSKDAGMMLALMGVISAIVQGGLIGRLSKKFGEVNLVMFGFLCMGLFMSIFIKVDGTLVFKLCLMGIGLGSGLVNPSLMSLLSKGSVETKRGAVMGVYQSAGSLARVIGPPFAGILFDRVSIHMPFLVSSMLLLVAFLASCVVLGRRRYAVS